MQSIQQEIDVKQSMMVMAGLFLACLPAAAQEYPEIGEVVSLDPRFAEVIDPDAKIEVVASGWEWSEGPCWVPEQGGYLLFSDVLANTIYRWSPSEGAEPFLKPSGFTGHQDHYWNGGSNGLLLNRQGELLCFEHGDRRISRVTPGGGKMTVVDRYQGKRLNSPNDGVFDRQGNLYFTDPPYGMKEGLDSPFAELDFAGVYRLGTDGELTLIDRNMSRPNGIGISPDGKTLYVSQCDPEEAIWNAFPIANDGSVGPPRVFADMTDAWGKLPGLVDGLAIDVDGRIWGTSPGGVSVFLPDGTLIGRISTGQKTANCTFGGPDHSVLYLTSEMHVCRIATKTKGFQPFEPKAMGNDDQ